jgi:TusA-related sulfurtransferase
VKIYTCQPDKVVDFGGLRCPHLVIATIKALAAMEAGQILQISASDLHAPSNVVSWCRQSGHQLIDMYEENGRFVFFVQRN